MALARRWTVIGVFLAAIAAAGCASGVRRSTGKPRDYVAYMESPEWRRRHGVLAFGVEDTTTIADLREKLKHPIDVDLSGVRFEDGIDWLTDHTNINVVLDRKALTEQGVRKTVSGTVS